jgi:hypothetical protein
MPGTLALVRLGSARALVPARKAVRCSGERELARGVDSESVLKKRSLRPLRQTRSG